MILRILNICVIVALVFAAADVYKIKFESTRQAQRVAKLRMEIRREHDAIAALRGMGQARQSRAHPGPGAAPSAKPVEGRQFDTLDNLPERPPDVVPVEQPDPIGTLIAGPETSDRSPTGSVPAAEVTSMDTAGRSARARAPALAPSPRGHAALRPRRRPHRQGAGADRTRHSSSLGYAVIAGRLVLFAALPEGHTRRVVTHDAVATARPDILDRNGKSSQPTCARPPCSGAAADHRRR